MSTETIITGAPAAEPSAADASFWKNNLRDYGLLVSLLLIMAFFEVVTGGVLFRGVNVTNLILQNSYIVIMALGMLLVIVTGHIDLSVGSVAGFVGPGRRDRLVFHAATPYCFMIEAMIFSCVAPLAGISSTKRPSFMT